MLKFKSLLSLLGVTTITASTIAATGFSYGNHVKSGIEKRISDLIQISSLVAKGAILNQKEGFNYQFATDYYAKKKVSDIFGPDFVSGDIGNSSVVGNLFSKTFGQWNYKIDKNNLQNNLGLTDDGITGTNSTIDTLSTVSALVEMIFGKNFTPTIAPMLESLIASGKADNFLGNSTGILDQITNIIGQGDNNLFKLISNAMNETNENDLKDIAGSNEPEDIENLTIGQVLIGREKLLSVGLAKILWSGKNNEEPAFDYTKYDSAIKVITALLGKEKIPVNAQLNQIMIEGISSVLTYIKTLLIYLNQFNNVEGIMNIDDIEPNSENIFVKEKTNKDIMKSVLESKYLDYRYENEGENQIIRWYTKTVDTNNKTYYPIIDFKRLFGNLQMWISPNKNANNVNNGYGLQRFLFILLGTSGDKKNLNPIGDGILSEANIKEILIQAVGLNSFVAGIASGFVKGLINNVANNESIQNTMNLIKNLSGLIPEIKPFAPLIEKLSEMRYFDKPFTSLYSQNFIKELLLGLNEIGTTSIDDKIIDALQNIKHILTLNITDLLSAFGLDISTLPIFLYNLKNISLSEIIDNIAAEFETSRDYKYKDNIAQGKKNYLLNTYSLDKILSHLNKNVEIEIKDYNSENPDPIQKWVYEKLENQETGELGFLQTIIVVLNSPNSFEIKQYNSENIKGISKVGYLLGMRKNNNGMITFEKDSLMGALTMLYGNSIGNDKTDDPISNIESVTKIIKEFGELANWFNGSISSFTKDIIDPKFANQNWKTSFIEEQNVNNPNDEATIIYDLQYNDFSYRITIKRDANDPVNYNEGKWHIASIYDKSLTIAN